MSLLSDPNALRRLRMMGLLGGPQAIGGRPDPMMSLLSGPPQQFNMAQMGEYTAPPMTPAGPRGPAQQFNMAQMGEYTAPPMTPAGPRGPAQQFNMAQMGEPSAPPMLPGAPRGPRPPQQFNMAQMGEPSAPPMLPARPRVPRGAPGTPVPREADARQIPQMGEYSAPPMLPGRGAPQPAAAGPGGGAGGDPFAAARARAAGLFGPQGTPQPAPDPQGAPQQPQQPQGAPQGPRMPQRPGPIATPEVQMGLPENPGMPGRPLPRQTKVSLFEEGSPISIPALAAQSRKDPAPGTLPTDEAKKGKPVHPLVAAGLLSNEDLKGVNSEALLSAGLSLLASSGPTTEKVGFGEAIGRAGQAYLEQRRQGESDLTQKAILGRDLKREEEERNLMEMLAAERTAALANPPAGLSETQQRLWPHLNLDQREELLADSAKRRDPIAVAEGTTLYSEEARGVIYGNQRPEVLPTEIQENFAYIGLDPNADWNLAAHWVGGDDELGRLLLEVEIGKRRSAATSVTQNNLPENAQGRVYTHIADRVNEGYIQSQGAHQTVQSLDGALDLLDRPEVRARMGSFSNQRVGMERFFSDVLRMGDGEAVAMRDQLMALSNRVAVGQLHFFPGQISDKELEEAKALVGADVRLSPEAAMKTMQSLRKVMALQVENHNRALGALDPAIFGESAQWFAVPAIAPRATGNSTNAGRRIP